MPRTINADISNVLGNSATEPRYLFELGFDPVVRLTNAETLIQSGVGTFTAAQVEVQLSSEPRIRIFNEQFAVGAQVLLQGTAGKSLKIWMTYRDTAITGTSIPLHAEPVLVFDGEMSDAEVGNIVSIRGKKFPSKFTPKIYVDSPVFNHLPKAGTVIIMPNQKVTLE